MAHSAWVSPHSTEWLCTIWIVIQCQWLDLGSGPPRIQQLAKNILPIMQLQQPWFWCHILIYTDLLMHLLPAVIQHMHAHPFLCKNLTHFLWKQTVFTFIIFFSPQSCIHAHYLISHGQLLGILIICAVKHFWQLTFASRLDYLLILRVISVIFLLPQTCRQHD